MASFLRRFPAIRGRNIRVPSDSAFSFSTVELALVTSNPVSCLCNKLCTALRFVWLVASCAVVFSEHSVPQWMVDIWFVKSCLNLRTLFRHSAKFLLEKILKRQNFWTHFSSSACRDRKKHERTFLLYLTLSYWHSLHSRPEKLYFTREIILCSMCW